MRVIAGTYHGKKLLSPTDNTTRPTSDRARESLFNILTSLFLKNNQRWENMTVADIFAGTGAVGIEALSRGAASATFIDNNPTALKILKQNTNGLPHTTVLPCDALTPPPHPPVSLLFMDAPYGQNLWQQALVALTRQGWTDNNTLVIIETDNHLSEQLPPGYTVLQRRSAGRNVFLFAELEKDVT